MTAWVLAASAICAIAAGLLGGCSGVSGFPGVLDDPPPRNDTTLSPDEVQRATTDLITERDRLSAEAQSDAQAETAGQTQTGTVPPATKVSATNSAAKKKTPPAVQPVVADTTTQAAGSDPKP